MFAQVSGFEAGELVHYFGRSYLDRHILWLRAYTKKTVSAPNLR